MPRRIFRLKKSIKNPKKNMKNNKIRATSSKEKREFFKKQQRKLYNERLSRKHF